MNRESRIMNRLQLLMSMTRQWDRKQSQLDMIYQIMALVKELEREHERLLKQNKELSDKLKKEWEDKHAVA